MLNRLKSVYKSMSKVWPPPIHCEADDIQMEEIQPLTVTFPRSDLTARLTSMMQQNKIMGSHKEPQGKHLEDLQPLLHLVMSLFLSPSSGKTMKKTGLHVD